MKASSPRNGFRRAYVSCSPFVQQLIDRSRVRRSLCEGHRNGSMRNKKKPRRYRGF